MRHILGMLKDIAASRIPAESSVRPRLLVVEDDDSVRRTLHLLLHGNGYDVRSYAAMSTLLADPSALSATHLVSDYRLPDGDGLGVLRALRRQGWEGRAVLLTGSPTPTLCDAAHAAGFHAVLLKPVREQVLAGALGA